MYIVFCTINNRQVVIIKKIVTNLRGPPPYPSQIHDQAHFKSAISRVYPIRAETAVITRIISIWARSDVYVSTPQLTQVKRKR